MKAADRAQAALVSALTEEDGGPGLRRVLVHAVRWAWLLYRALDDDRAFIRAAGMAYITLASLVPALLLIFAVVNGTGLLDADDDSLQRLVFDSFLGAIPQVRELLLPGLLAADLGTLGLAGVLGLLFVAARLFALVEVAYCDIFGVRHDRPFVQRLLIFQALVLAAPVALSVSILQVVRVLSDAGLPGAIGFVAPLLQLGILIGAIRVLPSTHVRWGAAASGGTVTWVLIHIAERAFSYYLTWFRSDDPVTVVYGSFGVIPVALLWLYTLWILLLLGVEIAALVQNYHGLLEAEVRQLRRSSQRIRALDATVALEISARVGWSHQRGRGPLSSEVLAQACDLTAAEVTSVATVLADEGVLIETPLGWVPARPPRDLPVREIEAAWARHTAPRPLGSKVTARVRGELGSGLEGSLEDAIVRWFDLRTAASGEEEAP